MRILSKRQLKELVLYSPQHIARLEKAGQFPQRVQLGPNRVAWGRGARLACRQIEKPRRTSPTLLLKERVIGFASPVTQFYIDLGLP